MHWGSLGLALGGDCSTHDSWPLSNVIYVVVTYINANHIRNCLNKIISLRVFQKIKVVVIQFILINHCKYPCASMTFKPHSINAWGASFWLNNASFAVCITSNALVTKWGIQDRGSHCWYLFDIPSRTLITRILIIACFAFFRAWDTN